MTVEQAKRVLDGVGEVLGVETVGLEAALGRVLAEEVRADRDLPPTDRSAMDGFAVRTADLPEADRVLEVAGEIRAGQPVAGIAVEPGCAIRIMTGAIVPPGADAVVMVELTAELDGGARVRVREIAEPGQHVRRRGEDLREGDVVLAPGTPIRPAEVAALAALGRTAFRAYVRPRVAVLSTGDEIVEPGEHPSDHEVRNSNAFALLAQLARLGIAGEHLGNVRDDGGALAAAVGEGLGRDVLLLTGGVSMGAYDLVGAGLAAHGVETLFHRVAMRPGKPILAGRRDRTLVFALPGNPVSAFTGFHVFVAPVLRRILGHARPENPEVTAVLDAPLKRRPGRDGYGLGRLVFRDGRYHALPVRTMGSGDVASMARADAFLVAPAGTRTIPPGSEVRALPWDRDCASVMPAT